MKRTDYWTSEELAVLQANASLTNPELAKLLPSRGMDAIKQKRTTLGLGRHSHLPRRNWTEADFEFMRSHPEMTDADMARAMGVRLGSLSTARKRADIRKVYRCVKCSVVLAGAGKWCSEHNLAARRWTQYASKAAARGLGFTLTHDDLHELLEQPCAYCGGDGGGIDRIDSDKGYQHGNVNPCCWRCNAMKNDMPMGDWIAHMQRVLGHMGESK